LIQVIDYIAIIGSIGGNVMAPRAIAQALSLAKIETESGIQ
jgi:hypothetical protein